MAFKVTKKYGKFAIVKDDYWDKWLVVDVLNGHTVTGGYYLPTLKVYAKQLESGSAKVSSFESKWNHDYLNPIDMPKSLKAQQAQMQKQAAAQAASEAAGISKPIGSNAPSIVGVIDKGAYKIAEMSDGTFGTLVPSTGQSKLGFASKLGASMSGSNAAKKHAAGVLAGQGVDPGSNAVDTLIDLYEGRVREMYGQAYREMTAKQARFMERFQAQQAEMIAKHDAGEVTQNQLRKWYSTQSAMAQRNAQLVDAMASELHNADKRAMQMLNGYMGPAYAENFNYATYQIEKAGGISTSFSLYNRNAVENILKNPDIQLLPTVDDARDMAWCRKKVSSCIAQSILQGDSVPDAAARLQSVVGMGANSAVRAARTALTGAQNLGRLDAGERAKAMGIELRKQWVATADDRTRDTHRELDRETVEIEDDFSNGCAYPGDPSGDPSEVFNCRCAMRYVLPGHEYDDVPDVTREGKDYEEWKNSKKLKEEAEKDKLKSQVEELDAQKSRILDALPKDEKYAANDLLKHPTSLSKWEQEKQAIADSKAYCENKLKECYKHFDQESGEFTALHWADKAGHYEKKLDTIETFDAQGKAYFEAKKAVQGQLDAIDAQKKEIGAKLAKLSGNAGAYSKERLDAARRFATKQEADDALRSISGRAWREATMAEKRAINTYTGGAYDGYNIPLNGFRKSYRDYVGVDKIDIDDMGRGREIRDMTRIIERSVTEEDMWLRRGVGRRTMSDFFGLDPTMDITSLSDETLQSFVGTSNRIGSFQSCGTTFDTGFTHKPVTLEVFVPKGSEAMYVEPISKCGNGAGLKWDGIAPQYSLGGELETIIQRGGSYTCTGFRYSEGKPTFTLELHPEDGYWKFQQ